VFDEAASDVSRFRKLVERIPEMHNAQFGWVVQYNLIRTQLRKVSSQLTATVNIAKHHFLEVRRSPRARECASGFQGACPGARTLTSSSAGDGGGGMSPVRSEPRRVRALTPAFVRRWRTRLTRCA